jgi:hypothetical protein
MRSNFIFRRILLLLLPVTCTSRSFHAYTSIRWRMHFDVVASIDFFTSLWKFYSWHCSIFPARTYNWTAAKIHLAPKLQKLLRDTKSYLGSFLSFRICCIISGLRSKSDGWYQNTVSAMVTWWYQFFVSLIQIDIFFCPLQKRYQWYWRFPAGIISVVTNKITENKPAKMSYTIPSILCWLCTSKQHHWYN